jgi:SAM-dependent methyltransferase
MGNIAKDVVSLAHWLILGYHPTADLVDLLAARFDSLEQLRGHLMLHFDSRRHMEMLKVMEFLYHPNEERERRHEIEMDAFLELGPAVETGIRAAINAWTDDYTRFHRRRFFDQVRALGAIRSKTFGHLNEINVLDVGVMPVSRMYAHGIEGFRLHTTDHPRRANENSSFGTADFYPADLETEDLSVLYPELIGKFHAIIFCEVLEHLKLRPREVLSDFRRLLAPGGMMYLTTPNGMSYGTFLSYFESLSPVVRYSRAERSLHLENFIHVREYTMRELVAEFEAAGLRIAYRSIKEYFDPTNLWTTGFIGARSLLCYIAEAQ